MLITEKTSVLEIAEQVKKTSCLGKRSAKRNIAKIRRICRTMVEMLDSGESLHKLAATVGVLFLTTLQLMASLRLDSIGCIQLAGKTPDDEGNSVLSMRTEIP
jgi:hypothetical protein